MIQSNHKSETLLGTPDKKLGGENDGHGPTKKFMRPKMRKSFSKFMDFWKMCREIFYFFYQIFKTDHFLGQFTIRYT